MESRLIKWVIVLLSTTWFGCSLYENDYEINDEKGIQFYFDEGLNDNPSFRLPKDENGYYLFEMSNESQNIQRISVRLLRDGDVLYSPDSGHRHKLEWSSNLYWWLLDGDIVANITRTYFNRFTGELVYVNLPPLVNWKDYLVPVINESSITDDITGRGSTVISPIGEMRGDTLIVYVSYNHQITKQKKGSSFFESMGFVEIRDSVKIILN